jgi:hypothetical protein
MTTTHLALTCLLGEARPEWIQAVATVVLVVVTGVYARTTCKMAWATERMATENDRLRKEGDQAALRYLSQEARMNTDVLYKDYDPVLKGGPLGSLPLVRFWLSGTEVMPKVVAYLGDIVQRMLECYWGMRRVNALIEEYYASSMHEQRRQRLLQSIPEELKRLDAGGKFKDSMATIASALDAKLRSLS